MYSLLKNIRKIKVGITFLIMGLIVTILFICLLVINHLNVIRINNVYKTFDKNSNYEIVLNTSKYNQKIKLFDYDGYHFYGYGIKNVSISYDDAKMSLDKIFTNNYLSLEEFLNNFNLVYTLNDFTMTKYQKGKFVITIENLFGDYKEVIISKID